ncbi:uncharacterized protein [Venturia canescens]|uniref:uncharacterized protein n=1 Tax=Venturia canescens TaxID=32260 RepID=UPI001C9BCE81|nr:uncharacterized protein LOC122409299 [Venturia canescens]
MSRDHYSAGNDSSLNSVKTSVKKMTCITENTTTTIKDTVIFEEDKENRYVNKQSEKSTSVVKQLKVFYEEYSSARMSQTNVSEPQNATSTGAIKKRKLLEGPTDFERSKHFVPKKRPSIRDDEAFGKTRFKIYNDSDRRAGRREITIDEPGGSTAKNDSNNTVGHNNNVSFCPHVVDKRLDKIKLPELNDRLSTRVTPVDIFPLPPTIKKVKEVHRNRLLRKCERSNFSSGVVPHGPQYEIPYHDFFIEYELAKETAAAKLSKNFRHKNITTAQRTIIVKFLTKLQSHLFLPSYLLYQTVRLFDAVLDAKEVEMIDFQLIALTAMWIVLKKDHIGCSIPTAQKMISYSKDLYEGRVDLLVKCEIDILQTLNFNIVFPDPFSIMCYNITACNHSQFMNSATIHFAYCCGSYMIDISLFDEDLLKFSVVLLAAAVAEVALYFTMETPDPTVEPLWSIWRAPHTAKRYEEDELTTVKTLLIRKVFESHKRHSDTDIVFKKYIRSRYGRISHFLGEKVKIYLNED